MHGIDTQFLQVLDGPGFGQGHELTFVLGLRTVHREITVVHLLDHDVLPGTDDDIVWIVWVSTNENPWIPSPPDSPAESTGSVPGTLNDTSK